MSEGYAVGTVDVSDEDLKLISKYTQKDFNKEDLFLFNVVLCDNRVDRDFEKFSLKSLYEMASLFEGKTGIFDHSMKAKDQSARIFKTEVVELKDEKTEDGETAAYLKARAYMVRNAENSGLITDIEAGIKKEVSVSVSAAKSICSICKNDKRAHMCEHVNSKKYGKKRAFSILEDITDAYEWSFVAVPAQRGAGVTKSFVNIRKDNNMDIIKSIKSSDDSITLDSKAKSELISYLDLVEEDAKLGKEYKKELQKDVLKLCKKTIPTMDMEIFTGVTQVMTTTELKGFITAFEQSGRGKDLTPQIAKKSKEQKTNLKEFLI